MKPSIHPTYYSSAKTVCACGNEFSVGSTKEETRVELCSKCHPFYTGQQKLIDTSGRVERFAERVKAQSDKTAAASGKKAKAEKRAAQKEAKKTVRQTIDA